jgi:hypothetical protein
MNSFKGWLTFKAENLMAFVGDESDPRLGGENHDQTYSIYFGDDPYANDKRLRRFKKGKRVRRKIRESDFRGWLFLVHGAAL